MTFKRDKRDLTQFLQDILEAIDDIEGFVKEMEFNEFSGDKKTIYAVMKALEIIGEATTNLPDTLKNEYPDVMEVHGRNPRQSSPRIFCRRSSHNLEHCKERCSFSKIIN